MSNFGLFEGIYPEDKVEMVKLGNKSGHHIYFDGTMEYPERFDLPMPLPKKAGYTVRIFIYVQKDVEGFAEIKIEKSGGHCMSCIVPGNHFYECEVQGLKRTQRAVLKGTFYALPNEYTSLAVRIENATTLKSYYQDHEFYDEPVDNILTGNYRIYIQCKKYRLFSLHVTVETDNKNEPWLSDSLLWDRPLPVQSSMLYTVQPKKDKPSQLYIELQGSGKAKLIFTNDVKKGQRLVLMVRLASNCLVVTNNFDKKKPHAMVYRMNERHIIAKFQNDLEIISVDGNVPYYKPT